MILPARGQSTTEFYVACSGAVVLAIGLVFAHDSAVYAGAAVISSYVLSRGIAKAGFGRAVHEPRRGI